MSVMSIKGQQTEVLPSVKRQQFQRWLHKHRSLARKLPFPSLIAASGVDISASSAYRVAVREGLRGGRTNKSRFDKFWKLINWDLPDAVLEGIWSVTRGNLRQRRLRLGCGPASFIARNSNDPRFNKAIIKERHRVRLYHGPRPR